MLEELEQVEDLKALRLGNRSDFGGSRTFSKSTPLVYEVLLETRTGRNRRVLKGLKCLAAWSPGLNLTDLRP